MGGLNGVYQVAGDIRHRICKHLMKEKNVVDKFCSRLIKICITFILVDFTWIFFRAKNIRDAFAVIKSIFTCYNPWVIFDGSFYECGLNEKEFHALLLSIIVIMISDICRRRNIRILERVYRQDAWFRYLFVAFCVCVVAVFGIWGTGYESDAFIYFQF